MKKLLAALFALLISTQAHSQGALYAPWQFLAGPTTAGPNAFANPRGIVGADLPNAASPNSGTLGITNGGTGASSQLTAAIALLPAATINGTIAYWNGANWVIFAGNTSGTQFLSENAAGVPAWASPSGAGTVTSVTLTAGAGFSMSGTCTSTSVITCTVQPIFLPQGRLTLTTATPVLTSNVTSVSTLFYDCYNGGRFLSIYNGTIDVSYAIAACEIGDTLPTTGTGVVNNNGVFDVWAINVSSAAVICHATNGSGGGWASDTGGSNTARGTGYSQLDTTTRPYITNKNSITNCYNGVTQEGPISANQATYLGSFYTVAAGKVSMQFEGTPAAGGSNTILGLFNAYNPVPVIGSSYDNNASGWSPTVAGTWQVLDIGATGSGLNNRITWVDGLGKTKIQVEQVTAVNSENLTNPFIGNICDATTGTPSGKVGVGPGASGGTLDLTAVTSCVGIGLHFVQAMQFSSNTGVFYTGGSLGAPVSILQILSARLSM